MTTTRTTTDAPAFPTAAAIAAAVNEHHAEERRDRDAARALLRLSGQLSNGADDPEPDLHGAFQTARVSGQWDDYAAVYAEHLDWRERAQRRAVAGNELREASNRITSSEDRHAHRAAAGRLTLDYLAGALPEVLAAARALELEDVPGTAEAALRAGADTAARYTAAAQVVEAYTAARTAQAEAVRDIARQEIGAGDRTVNVWTTGQFADALHVDATWLSARRHALAPGVETEAARELRARMARVDGAAAFFTGAPAELFGPIGRDGFPRELDTVPARARWLAVWSERLTFTVPTWEQLHALAEAYRGALDPLSWRRDDGLVIYSGVSGAPAEANAEAVRLVRPDYVRPDWDGDGAEDDGVREAAEANAAAAQPEQHPGIRAS